MSDKRDRSDLSEFKGSSIALTDSLVQKPQANAKRTLSREFRADNHHFEHVSMLVVI